MSRTPLLHCVQYLRACLAAHSLESRSDAAPSDHVPITLRFEKRIASCAGVTSTRPHRPNTTRRLWIRPESVRIPWLDSITTATRRRSCFPERRPRRRRVPKQTSQHAPPQSLLPVGRNQAQCLEPALHLAEMSSWESTRPGAEMTMANQVPTD